MSNREKLKACFIEALALMPDAPVEELTYQGHPAWDSVGHMRLVAAIETSLDLMLTTDQILDMSSFDKACEIVENHGLSLVA